MKNLLKIEQLIMERNAENDQIKMDLPSFKAVITGGEYGYRRPDGVYIIPIGCLGP